MSKDIRRQKAKLAAATRHYPGQDHRALKRDLAAANLQAFIEKTIASAPPLTPEQLDRIAVILRPVVVPASSNLSRRASTAPALADKRTASGGS